MTVYECFNLAVGVLTLTVLSLTLAVVKAYARDTKKIARAAVEQLPRPCVVVKRSADHADNAVLRDTTVSLADQRNLNFANVGTGPAVNCRYHVLRDTWETTDETASQLPEIGPAENFESSHSLNALPESAVVIIEYESVAGSRYRTELMIEDRMWVTKISFLSS